MSQPGRPHVFEDAQKQIVCALARFGCSRRQAAQYLGCDEGTIRYAVATDESFAQQLRQAEAALEVDYLKRLKKSSTRSWRASAWALERLRPDRYAPRRPGPFRDEPTTTRDEQLQPPE